MCMIEFTFYILVISFEIISMSGLYLNSALNSLYFNKTLTKGSILARTDVLHLTAPSENPHAVLILTMKHRNIYQSGICSGSILTNKWVLTAGHCIKKHDTKTNETILLEQFVLYAGGIKYGELVRDDMSPGSQALWAELAICHPKQEDQLHDIGIIRVTGPGFIFNDVVKLIKMAMHPYYYTNYYKCYFTGFGRVESGHPHAWDGRRKTQEVEIFSNNTEYPCQATVLRYLKYSDPKKYLICSKRLEDTGICPGDSGAGLVCNGDLHGVAGFFIYLDFLRCAVVKGVRLCGTRDSLSFFFDTCQYASWIVPQVDPKLEIYPTLHKKHDCWNREVAFV